MEKSWNCVFEFLWEPCSLFGKVPVYGSPVYKVYPLVYVFFDFSLSVKAAPHECEIRNGQP